MRRAGGLILRGGERDTRGERGGSGEDRSGGGWVTPAETATVVETDLGRIGLMICFDGDYPELARVMAVRGAEVICRPSALLRSADIWELTTRARAYDNHVFVVAANATGLGIDAARIAVAGSSAGAALAAGLAHRAADGSLPPIVFQLLHQPVLDDRATASKAEFATSPAFDGEAAELMWRHYLASDGSAAAVPVRRSRFEGLPDTLITCAEIDPFRDEAIEYAQRLLRAGVGTELHVFARACHGFDSLLPDWSVSQRLFALQGDALRRIWDDA